VIRSPRSPSGSQGTNAGAASGQLPKQPAVKRPRHTKSTDFPSAGISVDGASTSSFLPPAPESLGLSGANGVSNKPSRDIPLYKHFMSIYVKDDNPPPHVPHGPSYKQGSLNDTIQPGQLKPKHKCPVSICKREGFISLDALR